MRFNHILLVVLWRVSWIIAQTATQDSGRSTGWGCLYFSVCEHNPSRVFRNARLKNFLD